MNKVWIICSPILYLNIKSLMEPNSSSLNWNLINGKESFCTKLSKLKYRRVEQIIQTFCKIGSPQKLGRYSLICRNFNTLIKVLQNLNLKCFMDPNSSSLIRFQWILPDAGELFSESWSFLKLKRGELISGVNRYCRKSDVYCPPLLYLNFKSFMDWNSSSLLDSNGSCMILEYFSQSLDISPH